MKKNHKMQRVKKNSWKLPRRKNFCKLEDIDDKFWGSFQAKNMTFLRHFGCSSMRRNMEAIGKAKILNGKGGQNAHIVMDRSSHKDLNDAFHILTSRADLKKLQMAWGQRLQFSRNGRRLQILK